ncbi:MAG TPA: 3D domain-containing protein [Humisphaera sp.]|nr:3D domain-containing protein [Humisphaera sp.]
MWMFVTAYCACKKCCGSHAVGMTASGRPISYNGGHFIAADTTILPYGSKVIVPGYDDGHPVEVIDRGGAIKGAHIDVFMPTHEEAVEWGKKRLEITIVKWKRDVATDGHR